MKTPKKSATVGRTVTLRLKIPAGVWAAAKRRAAARNLPMGQIEAALAEIVTRALRVVTEASAESERPAGQSQADQY